MENKEQAPEEVNLEIDEIKPEEAFIEEQPVVEETIEEEKQPEDVSSQDHQIRPVQELHGKSFREGLKGWIY